MSGTVYLLGAGPGDPGLLTLKARDILASCDVIVYDALANSGFLAYARKDAEKIYVGKIADKHALPQKEINALLVAKALEGKSVARLKGGDPYIFGRGGEEAQELLAAGVQFVEVPGISSTISAPAYAGIPLTHRDFASSVTIVTGHENPDKGESALNWPALARSASTLVFVMGMKNLPTIVRNLLDAGMDPATPAALVYRGTTPRQRSLVSTLAELPEEAKRQQFTNPSVIVVGSVCRLHDELNWFEKRPLFGRSIVVTRAREQASGLAQSLQELGAEVVQFPVIRIDPLPQEPLDRAVAELPDYSYVVFTSVNGVRLFWQSLRNAGKDARALAGCRLVAIGPATAEALESHGLFADIVPDKYVAEGVIAALKKLGSLEGVRFLLPRAEKAREILPDALREAGALVDVVPCYRTVPEEAPAAEILERIRSGDVDCVTFGSSSTVENFLSLVPAEVLKEHPDVLLAAIGPVTAKTLEKHGLRAGLQPENYTIPDLVRALTAHYGA
ncbi:MAG: uroporphyrinogen-III C-methyltransferase [Desulfovibrionaceae bacterium]|nr:uroporphyrinogen-III C-methyltransferase [Desulfovibrionaceae bacterium]